MPCWHGRSELQDTVADLRAQLQTQAGQLERAAALESDLVAQQREADSLQSQLLEQQQSNDHLQREATLAHMQLEESREAFRVRIQHCMLEVWPLKDPQAHMHTFLVLLCVGRQLFCTCYCICCMGAMHWQNQ